jgi:tRNA(fMet)-specific endonuclease VapC
VEGVLLDTDVASGHYQQDLTPEVLATLAHSFACISLVTIMEAYQGAELAGWSNERTERLLRHYNENFIVLPWADNIAETYGRMAGRAQREGRTAPILDGLIAATAIVYGLPLLTFNRRHFESIPGLVLI